MENPNCFNKFDESSEFCNKICRHAELCSGNKIVRTEVDEIKFAYKRKILSMKELVIGGMKAIEKRCNLNK